MTFVELAATMQREQTDVLMRIRGWIRTYRTRRDLKNASPHLLRDVGLSAEQAQYEARRPFWQSDLH